jgi:hypothetical protein
MGLHEAEDIFKEMSSGFHQGHGERKTTPTYEAVCIYAVANLFNQSRKPPGQTGRGHVYACSRTRLTVKNKTLANREESIYVYRKFPGIRQARQSLRASHNSRRYFRRRRMSSRRRNLA